MYKIMMVETFVIVINVNKACSLQIPFIKILCCIKPNLGNVIIYNVKTSFTYCYCSSCSNSERKSNEDKYKGDFKWRGVKRTSDLFPSQLSTFQWNQEAGTPPVVFCLT
jgi:hypothetical protein